MNNENSTKTPVLYSVLEQYNKPMPFKNDNLNHAYVSLKYEPFDVNMSKIKGTIPVDMDLIVLGLNAANLLPDNRFVIYSGNTATMQPSVYHSGEPDGDQRLLASFEDVYIDFSQVPEEVSKLLLIMVSNSINVDNGSAFRSPLNKINGLTLNIVQSNDEGYEITPQIMSGLQIMNGKYACICGSFNRAFNPETNKRDTFIYEPSLDTDIPSDVGELFSNYGAQI